MKLPVVHFEAGNSVDMAAKIKWATTNPETMITIGKNAHLAYEAMYTPEANYQQLMAIYQQVINNECLKTSAQV